MKLSRPSLRKARIEIIPMIDTIFFLLVFFMMTSLSMVRMSAHRVALPQSATALARPPEQIVVSLAKNGEYFVDKKPVILDDVLPLLKERVRQNPGVAVVLNCDKEQSVSHFLLLMARVKEAEPATLLIATAPKNSRL